MSRTPTPPSGEYSEFPVLGAIPCSPITDPMHERDAEHDAQIPRLLANLRGKSDSNKSGAELSEPPGSDVHSRENQIAAVRLGVATSLFYALRAKHPATADHSLRVAILCSGWAQRLGLSDKQRDQLEVAALLHDIGKIGVPDRILRKPGKLTVDERLQMDTCPEMGCEILRGCTGDTELLDIVRYSGGWFKSRRECESPQGEALPIGARMLAICDAYDSMTTEHVYRPAMSPDRAIAELTRCAGTQFDPQLVVEFCRLVEEAPDWIFGRPVERWLSRLTPSEEAALGGLPIAFSSPSEKTTVRRETLFNQQLSASIKDGVVFTDAEGNVQHWNLAMQRLTGHSGDAMLGTAWSTSALGLRDTDRSREDETACPLEECLQGGQTVRRAMSVQAEGEEPVSLHVEVAPVFGRTPGMIGTVIVCHDLSDREQLEQRLSSLHQQTKLDPLTGVANRGHFDQCLADMVVSSAMTGKTFSLIICDLDHFKSVNDTFGHPAGDDALKVFSQLLRTHCREGDLVARYGGEEFLLLAEKCDNASAAKRAELLRRELESIQVDSLEGRTLTASFGVTEFQSGDSEETILARADRALLKAKDNGRNRVVQLGYGAMSEVPEPIAKPRWRDWFNSADPIAKTSVDLLTPVPADLAIEKLRGFIADHHADIASVAENQISLKLYGGNDCGGRRSADHRISFNAIITLSEAQKDELLTENAIAGSHTKVHLELKPTRVRDRRRREVAGASRQLVNSFRCYMVAEIINESSGG